MYKVFNNWKVVLLSILGATTFWFFNALNKNYDARISYPIDFVFERDSVVVMRPLPESVLIDVSSGGWNLLRKTFWFNVNPIQIVLENPSEIGFYTRNSLQPIIEEQLNELEINFVVTDTAFINIEPKKSKKVALTVDSLALDLAKNHRITSGIELQPDSILLIGPKSFIDTVSSPYSITLAIGDISKTFNRDIAVPVPNEDLIVARPREVRLAFKVERFERQSLEVRVEPVDFPSDSSFYLSEDIVQIFYTISQSNARDFSPTAFKVTASADSILSKDSTVQVQLINHPAAAMEIDIIPKDLKVIYEE